MREAKLKEGIVGQEIRTFFKHENVETTLSRKESRLWITFKSVRSIFLSNKISKNYIDVVKELV